MGGVLQIFFSAGEAKVASGITDRGGGGGDAWCTAFVAGVEGSSYHDHRGGGFAVGRKRRLNNIPSICVPM